MLNIIASRLPQNCRLIAQNPFLPRGLPSSSNFLFFCFFEIPFFPEMRVDSSKFDLKKGSKISNEKFTFFIRRVSSISKSGDTSNCGSCLKIGFLS